MMKTRACLLVGLILLTSCSALVSRNTGKNTISSSLMDFLYPKNTPRVEMKPQIPVLKLPVRVGLAFIPSSNYGGSDISLNTQQQLLERVKKAFIQYDFIDRIEIIPKTYLEKGQGFDSLEQVSRLYDVDIMALVSYDQVTQSLENNAALLYWTIVGMYLIPGNENSIQTFVDVAVFDVQSHQMLFRAPGLSHLKNTTTAVGVDQTMMKKTNQGFDLAVTDMITNLDAELKAFKVRVKEEKVANIEHRKGYRGGALGQFGLVLLMIFGLQRRNITHLGTPISFFS